MIRGNASVFLALLLLFSRFCVSAAENAEPEQASYVNSASDGGADLTVTLLFLLVGALIALFAFLCIRNTRRQHSDLLPVLSPDSTPPSATTAESAPAEPTSKEERNLT